MHRAPFIPPTTVESFRDAVRALYGDELACEAGQGAGVVHVAAIARHRNGHPYVLAINDSTPLSATDRFVLGLSRARSDAIITTGLNLRVEPNLRHDYHPRADVDRAFALWRRESSGRGRPPRSVILTSGKNFDFGHPVFREALDSRGAPSGARAGGADGRPHSLVVTGLDAAIALAPAAEGVGVEVVGRPEPSLRDCVSYLFEQRGVKTLSMEAGPTTARDLYRDPIQVDELMLSVYRGKDPDPEAVGPTFVSEERLAAAFGVDAKTGRPRFRSRMESQEESGRWQFLRYVRET